MGSQPSRGCAVSPRQFAMTIGRPCILTLLLGGAVAALPAAEPPIIAKARAYLGSEAALDGVRSVHLKGRITVVTPGKPDVPVRFDLVFQKPEQESLLAVFKDRFFRKVLDGYDGWMRIQQYRAGGPLVFDDRLSGAILLGTDEIRSLRADAWENLSFYRGIESVGGTESDLGPATVDGVRCEKVAFVHPGGIEYDRYFDQATGRLVFTESGKGSQIREQGEIRAGGIRFPKTIVLTARDAAGKLQTTTMNVEQAAVNESFPPDFFATPLPSAAPPAAPAVGGPPPANAGGGAP